MMVNDDIIDRFIDTCFPSIHLYQKVLLKQILKKNSIISYNPPPRTIKMVSRPIEMGGLRPKIKIYDDLVEKKGNTNGKEN